MNRDRFSEPLIGPTHGARLVGDLSGMAPCFTYDGSGFLIWDPSPSHASYSADARLVIPVDEESEKPAFSWSVEDLQREIRRVSTLLPAKLQKAYMKAYPRFMPRDCSEIWFPRTAEGIPLEKALAVIARLEQSPNAADAQQIEIALGNKGVFRVPDSGRFDERYHATDSSAGKDAAVGKDAWVSQGRVIQKALRGQKTA